VDVSAAPPLELRYAFSPDSKRLITWGSLDSNMKLWDTETGKRVERLSSHWERVLITRDRRHEYLFIERG
jgi:WD40 repeat protein